MTTRHADTDDTHANRTSIRATVDGERDISIPLDPERLTALDGWALTPGGTLTRRADVARSLLRTVARAATREQAREEAATLLAEADDTPEGLREAATRRAAAHNRIQTRAARLADGTPTSDPIPEASREAARRAPARKVARLARAVLLDRADTGGA